MRARTISSTLLLGLCLAAAAAQAEPKLRIAVLALQTAKGIDEATVALLDELLLTEMQEAGDFEIFGSSDIASMLSLEEQRAQITGCADNACLAEIGGALGVSLLVTSSVGAVGKKLLLNVKLIDVNEAKVYRRSSEVVAGEQDQLIGAIKRAVAKVVEGLPGAKAPRENGDATAATTKTTAAATDTGTPGGDAGDTEPEQGSGFLKVAPWLMLGLTVAAGGAGGAMLGMGQVDKGKLEDEVLGNDDWDDTRGSAETKSTVGIALLGVAGAATITTVVLFVVGESGKDAPEAAAAVIPTRGGATASLAVRF